MIGDWVSYNGKNTKIAPADMDALHSEWRDKIQPIALTAEILDKNGWKEMPSGTICYWDKTNKSNDIMCDSGLSFSFLGRTFYPKYVHELQHALRLCGLNELADNFKI